MIVARDRGFFPIQVSSDSLGIVQGVINPKEIRDYTGTCAKDIKQILASLFDSSIVHIEGWPIWSLILVLNFLFLLLLHFVERMVTSLSGFTNL